MDTRTHLPVQTEMSSARQSLGRLNDALSFIPTVMTTSLATAPGTEATGAPAARMAQIEQILEDALNEEENDDDESHAFATNLPVKQTSSHWTIRSSLIVRTASGGRPSRGSYIPN